MGEDLHPQVVHHPLTHERGQEEAAVLRRQLQQQGRDVEPGEEAEQAQVLPGNGDVERLLGEPGPDQSEARLREEQQHGAGRQPAVGPEVAHQAPEQRGVIAPAGRSWSSVTVL